MSQVFPAHWDVLPFSLAVKDATSEYSKLQKSEYLEQGRFPIVDQGQQKFGGYTDDESVVSLGGCPAVVFGDHTRIFKFIDEPFCLGADGAKVLEPKVELDKKFLFYYLSSLNIESAGYSRHFKFLKENVVPVPPLPEQKRIATILDKADAIRRKRQQTIQLADDFLRAVFLDMFGDPVSNPKGWEVKPLGSLVVNKDGKRIPIKAADRADMAGEYPYYGASGVIDYVNDFIFEGRHLLIGEDGANLLTRSTPIAFIADGRYWVNNHAHVLGEKNSLSLDYLAFSINMRGLESFVSGSAQPKLNQENLNKIPIQVPPLILVDKFSAILNGHQEYMGKMIISEPEVLFSSLSQKAFSGQLFARESPCA